jgi:hypothetical protein
MPTKSANAAETFKFLKEIYYVSPSLASGHNIRSIVTKDTIG